MLTLCHLGSHFPLNGHKLWACFPKGHQDTDKAVSILPPAPPYPPFLTSNRCKVAQGWWPSTPKMVPVVFDEQKALPSKNLRYSKRAMD